jgi:hypothetical protein
MITACPLREIHSGSAPNWKGARRLPASLEYVSSAELWNAMGGMVQQWSGRTNPSKSGSSAGAMQVSRHHASVETVREHHQSVRVIFVYIGSRIAHSHRDKRIDGLIVNTSGWHALNHQSDYPCSSDRPWERRHSQTSVQSNRKAESSGSY